jgi:type II secretory pathway pseudopilin PulG
MSFLSRHSAQPGQVGLIILLVMVVVSTIGLSVASRSTQEVSTVRQSQEAARTFAAAESAVERVLSEATTGSFTFPGDTQNLNYSDLAPDTSVEVNIAKQYSLNNRVEEGMMLVVDVTGAVTGNILRIEWGTSRVCTDNPASLIIEVVKVVAGVPATRYYTVAPCTNTIDNFTAINTNLAQYQGTQYAIRYSLTLQDNDVQVRVIPVYAATPMRAFAAGAWTLPPQQFRILSTGTNQTVGGRETKAVQVDRTQPIAPSILNFAMVSGTTIVK